MRNSCYSMLCVALFMTVFSALADGPHWQVPNPDYDPERERGGDANVPVSKRDYRTNPGDFLQMDEACIKYYEIHCSMSYTTGLVTWPPPKNVRPGKKRTKEEMKRDFYLMIMQRCAQAMREVDTYLPCPDSFPLWHEDTLREEMVKYAQRTWVLSTRLPAADAAACAEFCVNAFLDTVRFSETLRGPKVAGWMAAMKKRDQEVAKLLDQMANEKDPAKLTALRAKWTQLTSTSKRALEANVCRNYLTFRMITGDIPVCVSDAEMRMVEALVGMGPRVLQFFDARNPALKNPRVMRAVQAIVETMKKRWNLNLDGVCMDITAPNVTELLRKYAASPNTRKYRSALKDMGPKAWDHLVRLAEVEPPKVQRAALNLLRAFTNQRVSTTLEEIKPVVAKLLAEEKAKENPPEATTPPKPTEKIDLDPTKKPDQGEKKPEVPVAPVEEDE